MNKFILPALFLCTSLQAGNISVGLTNDILFSNFSNMEGKHEGLPDLVGAKLNYSFEGMNIFVKYNHTLEPIHFSYAVDANSLNGGQRISKKHFDMKYDAEFDSINFGISCQQNIKGVFLDASLSMGRGNFSANFKGLNTTNTYDGSILYTGSSLVSDFTIGATKRYEALSLNINSGYLFASSGNGGMTAVQDIDIFTNHAGPEIAKGSSLQGQMDFSGFKLGVNISMTF